ncbi:MAG TPA: D-alanine--D-alanine ligase family protein [Candidatus Acidoferrales bacterium]|nr:D-alanine--D-alanine ligase family protein [Candidatus Acidoferrales bacterium]
MNAKRIRVGVLFGGRSGEHEVSIASAQSVLRALDPEKYEAVPIGITKDGRWLVGENTQKLLPDVLKRGHRVMLPPDPSAGSLMGVGESPAGPPSRIDVMFPVLHGTFGEDGTVQGLLELAGVPYVGAGVLASAVGMDKDVQKRLFREAKLPVVEFLALLRGEWQRNPKAVEKAVARKFRFPVFVKPATLGSSVGMTKVRRAAQLPAAMDEAAQYAQKILVERAVNAREIEVAVLGNEHPETALPGEIIPHREFYDYTAKYLEEGTQLRIPAKLESAQVKRFQDYARRAFLAIECRGMARVDFFLERRTGRIYVNELNSIPGFTSISMYPKLWEASGVSYSQLIDRLIELALEEHQEKSHTKYAIELPEGAAGALGGGSGETSSS